MNWVFGTNSDFLIPYIFAAQYRRSKIFYTENSVRSNNLSLKYQCNDIGIRKFKFVAEDSIPFSIDEFSI